MNPSGCLVATGEWYDTITGQTFTESSDVDIDHHVALSQAHRSGADVWPSEGKRAFANHLLNSFSLQALDDSTNSFKRVKDPANWLPRMKAITVTMLRIGPKQSRCITLRTKTQRR